MPCRRILFLAHSASRGGAEFCLDTTLRHLDRGRYRFSAVFGWEGPMAESARRMGARVEVLPLAWWMCYEPSLWQYKNLLLGGPGRIGRLVAMIRRRGIDLVYTNTAVVFEGAIAARLAGVPHVWHVHEVLTPQHMRPRALPLGLIRPLIGRLSDRVIFESDAARRVCRRVMPPGKATRVYNSARFDGRAVSQDRCETRRRLGIGDDRCVVAWIGRFSERKNPLMLLRAAPLMEHLERTCFLLVGEGPLGRTVQKTIDGLGLRDRCRMVPFQDDPRPILQACDLLVLTSREESFGLVLVEAGAFGKPTVATRTQGPAEIIDDGRSGFLVRQDDLRGLAARLDRLVADPDQRRRMGAAARARVAERFSPAKNTRCIEAVVDEALQSREPRRGPSAG